MLEQVAERLRREAGIANDSPHRVRIHGIVPRNGQDPDAVRHNNVLASPGYDETGLFERPHRAKVRYSGYLRHAYAGTSTSRKLRSPARALATSR